jgi:hypothetical protein
VKECPSKEPKHQNTECVEGQHIVRNEVFGKYYHSPSSKPPLDPNVQMKAKNLLSKGRKPSAVLKKLVLSNEECTAFNTPFLSQLRQYKYKMKSKALPSNGALSNIIAMHKDTILQEICLFPHIHISLCSPQTLSPLIDYGSIVFIDRT